MRAKKSLGQNFLMHARIAERIVLGANISEGDTVLEIGPGTGMLTKPLLARAKKVIAIEKDAQLLTQLRMTFADDIESGRLELIEGDVREFDPSSLKTPYALVANIPYNITGEIIRMFLGAAHKPRSMTLLVQKEVAERIAREKKGSLLSIAVKAYGTPKYLFTVPRGAFVPAPNVDSAVIHIDAVRNPFATGKEESRFFEVLRAGFAFKRKRLQKNLESVAAKDAIAAAFNVHSIAQNARAEELPLSAWQQLSKSLS